MLASIGWCEMNYLLAVFSIVGCFGYITYEAQYYYKEASRLKVENKKLYQDNKNLIEFVDSTQKSHDRLIKAGWSEGQVQNFIQQGCTMYMEVQ